MEDDYVSGEDDDSMEMKKELSDGVVATLSDAIFDTIPYMAKLLSNLRCSFSSEDDEIVVKDIALSSLRELFVRLNQSRLCVSRMDCGADDTFSLTIDSGQIVDGGAHVNDSPAMQVMPWLAASLCGQDVSLHLSPTDVSVRALSRESLSSVMEHLRLSRVRPARIFSTKESLFTLSFTQGSLPREYRSSIKVRGRPRAVPTYLRDYVVDKDEPQVPPFDLQFPDSQDAPQSPQTSDDSPSQVKRARGRPRIYPRPLYTFPKRPRGRPRRSDFIPTAVSDNNSFINIQPRNLSMEDIRNCFARFLESDIMRTNSQ